MPVSASIFQIFPLCGKFGAIFNVYNMICTQIDLFFLKILFKIILKLNFLYLLIHFWSQKMSFFQKGPNIYVNFVMIEVILSQLGGSL